MVVVGTRPEAIKLAPVFRAFRRAPRLLSSSLVVTGQHREMVDSVLGVFGLEPDHDLDLMRPDQSPSDILARGLLRMPELFRSDRPDLVLVQGDTTTCLMAALAAFYAGIPVAHVEAGLRTGNMQRPFPEEMHRRLVAPLADLHFAPTESARRNLLGEGILPERIHVVGNTGIDALLQIARRTSTDQVHTAFGITPGNRIVVVTLHRRETLTRDLVPLLRGLRDLVARHHDVSIAFPVHPNPRVAKPVRTVLDGVPRIHLLPWLDYVRFVSLMKRAYLVMTDSGGIQEEAPALGVPVLVLRTETERGEGLASGSGLLVGTDVNTVLEATRRCLDDERVHHRMSRVRFPYGNGKASQRIVEEVLRRFQAISGRAVPADQMRADATNSKDPVA